MVVALGDCSKRQKHWQTPGSMIRQGLMSSYSICFWPCSYPYTTKKYSFDTVGKAVGNENDGIEMIEKGRDLDRKNIFSAHRSSLVTIIGHQRKKIARKTSSRWKLREQSLVTWRDETLSREAGGVRAITMKNDERSESNDKQQRNTAGAKTA